ncbi:MAG: hypothetical protein EOP61_37160 [Sphingomonadales bacterium]|nr:MAG: hypothetical protein EOP61_37160 [Sphingomonadales bacterium]
MSNEELLRALVRQDIAQANDILADYPGLRGGLSVERVHNNRSIEAAPVWRIEADGTSRFRFHACSWERFPELIFTRWIAMLPLIAPAVAVGRPGRCWFSLGDEAHRPGLTFCGNAPEHIPVPDPYFMESHGYQGLRDAYARRDMKWDERAAIVFWRGTTTGPYHVPFAELPRVALSRIAKAMGERADIGLSSVTPDYADRTAWLADEGLLKDFVAAETFDRYQLHVDIDGNSNSWPGLMSKLHSGGAVLKVESQQGYRQWYYDRLEPWVHFVPVRPDLSDFTAQAERLLGDPALAERIGRAGQDFARSMTLEAEIARITPVVTAAFEPFDG